MTTDFSKWGHNFAASSQMNQPSKHFKMVNQIITIAFFCNSIQLKTICCLGGVSFNFMLNNLFQRCTLAGPSNLWVEILFWKLCKSIVSYMAAVSREKLTHQPSGMRTQVKVDVKRRSSRKKNPEKPKGSDTKTSPWVGPWPLRSLDEQ